jgi:hypothetical protein
MPSLGQFSLRQLRCGNFTATTPLRQLRCDNSVATNHMNKAYAVFSEALKLGCLIRIYGIGCDVLLINHARKKLHAAQYCPDHLR